MDKKQIHAALDDYFTSMLSVPVVEDAPKVSLETVHVDTKHVDTGLVDIAQLDSTIADVGTQLQHELQPVLSDVAVAVMSEFKIPEPDGSGSISDLDQLLGSVVDIDLADMDLSVLDAPHSGADTDAIIDTTVSADITVARTEESLIPEIREVEREVVEDIAVTDTSISHAEDNTVLDSASETALEADEEPAVEWKNIELEERFQALFFEVAGVTFAVPLTELGGIHQADTVNSLFGKPDWYLGIMQHREQKLSVVDTAQWVMPEQNMGEIDYKYQIQLSESNWVLGCEKLHGTETLNRMDIKWRSTAGSRPWLAGMVKSRMCVLLHVTEMIKLLDNGINIHGQ
ncbi:chemotaxis protein CheW [Moritella sp. F3]|uniref:chemotaxis protein CheW n=1 Tax=Moritella sp. F3 TaxID=2718882 RepID=UPI0018E1C071|nr:chemotaxis protein CheW [Moritella sp. F3]GIC78031.1 chemotaxis protein W [Moritella sp. F1]GIC82568.1 chemotaxis protein W [Moritella sp. F3]